jgi:pyruvate kinase
VGEHGTTAALAASIGEVMQRQKIAAIATFSAQGSSARLISKNRPRCPILALASQPAVARRACLYYGVVPRVIGFPTDVRPLLNEICAVAKQLQLASAGDRIIVLTGHPVGTAGGTRGLIVEEVA